MLSPKEQLRAEIERAMRIFHASGQRITYLKPEVAPSRLLECTTQEMGAMQIRMMRREDHAGIYDMPEGKLVRNG